MKQQQLHHQVDHLHHQVDLLRVNHVVHKAIGGRMHSQFGESQREFQDFKNEEQERFEAFYAAREADARSAGARGGSDRPEAGAASGGRPEAREADARGAGAASGRPGDDPVSIDHLFAELEKNNGHMAKNEKDFIEEQKRIEASFLQRSQKIEAARDVLDKADEIGEKSARGSKRVVRKSSRFGGIATFEDVRSGEN
jgi:hypothetical protein